MTPGGLEICLVLCSKGSAVSSGIVAEVASFLFTQCSVFNPGKNIGVV